jgi:5-methylcytosine-specific restriction protein B
MSDPIRRNLLKILRSYASEKEKRFGRQSHLWKAFDELKEAIGAAPSVRGYPTLRLRWSVGQGRWANVPWLALFDSRETDRMSDGVYVIFLFRADLSGVYLTLNQGASWTLAGYGLAGFKQLRGRAEILREKCAGLLARGDFAHRPRIDLRCDGKLAETYPHSTIAYRFYDVRDLPTDERLLFDLAVTLEAYRSLVPSSRVLGASAGPSKLRSLFRDVT